MWEAPLRAPPPVHRRRGSRTRSQRRAMPSRDAGSRATLESFSGRVRNGRRHGSRGHGRYPVRDRFDLEIVHGAGRDARDHRAAAAPARVAAPAPAPPSPCSLRAADLRPDRARGVGPGLRDDNGQHATGAPASVRTSALRILLSQVRSRRRPRARSQRLLSSSRQPCAGTFRRSGFITRPLTWIE